MVQVEFGRGLDGKKHFEFRLRLDSLVQGL